MDWSGRFFTFDAALAVALVGVLISLVIWRLQERQLRSLGEISSRQGQALDTLGEISLRQEQQLARVNEITARFQSDKERRERIAKFFKTDTRDPRYTLVYPSYFSGKPLDTVVAGDYFALSTLHNALNAILPERNLSLKPVPPSDTGGAEEEIPGGDLIFICAPIANSMLMRMFPTIDVRTKQDGDDLLSNKRDSGLVLPCWFVRDYRHGRKEPILKIWDLNEPRYEPLSSPAEETYLDAKKHHEEGRKIFVPEKMLQEDYAIIVRTKKDDRYIFILAGIHQYGTLMAAKYLHDLFEDGPEYNRKLQKCASLLLGNDDALIAIKGEFSHENFRAPTPDVAGDKWVWRKRPDGKWERST
jgi:hypothetical protein